MAVIDEEKVWIGKSRQGDHEAFEALIKCYQKMIHALTYRMTGSLTDGEDLAQDTFIQAFRQIHTYRGDSKFSSWLYRIGINLCLNWRKSQQRQQKAHEEYGQNLDTETTPDGKRAQQVQEALMKLRPKQRAAIVLTTYDGLNHAEAAQVLGCSETTVSWRIFAARTKLKKLLSKAHTKEVSHE
ncbi:RNA polymerase sigma factor [Pedosphaera parvula]|uniref:RNA polymerase, sigma-24 subunit, ECF subfamily n=1 Tax=Pedosphaera parvula (strain Ellin514) TaxID=320771 RepID=B9XQJ1_PEDPL|nr:RNA polymerase sigma factor [Pedosphaera parvula]EEF57916.1 RNA polymerase, sigma-24 subunit, ECF subfamily [Pedosphaera parvula Ellin514]